VRRFKLLESVDKSYEEQGEIFFLCRRYAYQRPSVRRKIEDLCRRAGGEYGDALFAYLTTSASWQEVTMRYHISDATLHRIRKKFYRLW